MCLKTINYDAKLPKSVVGFKVMERIVTQRRNPNGTFMKGEPNITYRSYMYNRGQEMKIGKHYKDPSGGRYISGLDYPLGYHVMMTIKNVERFVNDMHWNYKPTAILKIRLQDIHTVGNQNHSATIVGNDIELIEEVSWRKPSFIS